MSTRTVTLAQCWCRKVWQYTPIVELANGMRMTCGAEGCEPADALDAYDDVFTQQEPPRADPYATSDGRWYPMRRCADPTIHASHRWKVNDNPTDYDPWNPLFVAQCPGREAATNKERT